MDTEFAELLRDRNLKATPKRLELLSVVAKYNSAIPYSELQKSLHHFDRVTLYRTLNALLDGGIVHKASVSNEEVYYAMCKHYCSSEGHHHKHVHLKCKECLEVSCVEAKNTIVIDIPNVEIDNVEIEVQGTCSKCL
ncbi:Fur family transcriptional regulator [Wenyingzhuangia sp. 2_MG-2023]|uniref:Fur family transcriptional regulator n=1 Tax=Wenyingzhuangia sp. 2_MG-2023 TaxID=3062639 RepID=UPI0026E2CD04|nr:transcriptional repressor [Wenyingzhuangia sp. 2_MG-2023]MDO6738866.1 transcriptional repressor [Wenyingzhuangia sp. 2_MG-2023]MDO6803608.1 transcriptional repressor [Wenyingzhuangia sp. 1_MG-2023]